MKRYEVGRHTYLMNGSTVLTNFFCFATGSPSLASQTMNEKVHFPGTGQSQTEINYN